MLRYVPPKPRPRVEGLSPDFGRGEWKGPDLPDGDRDWLEHVTRVTKIGKNEYVPRVLHEVTHFTYPDPEAEDDWGRERWVTYHAFIRPDTEYGDEVLLAESHQYSYSRDWAPPPSVDVMKYTRHLIRRHQSQVTVTHFICDDDELRVSERVPVQGRWTECT